MKQRIKTLFAGGVLALALFAVAVAGQFEDGQAAYERGDYATAMSYWRPLAEQGNADAQLSLGYMYENGQGVPQDYAQAIAWWRKAADQGNADAELKLGWIYYAGNGVAQNDAQAIAWWRKAADQGKADAQFNLGLQYELGQDYAQAAMWYRKAADQGNADAQHSLGRAYAYGQGVPQDYVLAHMWFNLAASRMPSGPYDRDEAVKGRDRVATKMTPDQIAEAQKMAREWKPK